VAIGLGSLGADTRGSKSVAVGTAALQAQNFETATDSHNTAVGHNAGNDVTTGVQNTLIGSLAGDHITTANNNVALGYEALTANTTSANNIAIGPFALNAFNVTTGGDGYNVAIGSNAGVAVTTGKENTFVGAQAGDNTDDGNQNVAVGFDALSANCGDTNSAVGYLALQACTGTNNTAMGAAAGLDVVGGGNNTLLGHDAGRSTSPSGSITSGSNIICLGDNSVTDIFCNDTSISSSDSRDKTDINSFTDGLSWINALRPVTYKWDKRTWYGDDENPYGTPDGSKKQDRLHIGFLAQEVLAIEQANGYGSSKDTSLIVKNNEDEMSYGLKYERLVPVLVNAIKELSAKNDALEARIATLEGS